MTPLKKTVARQTSTGRSGRTTAPDVEAQLAAIERASGTGDLDLGGGKTLHVSSLNKVYFPEDGATKGALMRYYARIAPLLLPHVDGRPLVLKRYPEGVGGQMFFQQDAGPHVPDVVQVAPLPTEEKGIRARIIGGDLATLLYTVQLGAIEVHPWLSRLADIDSPDRCLIDLDPGDDVPFSAAVALARDVLRIIDECGLHAAVKTSGSSGIHLVIPLPPRTSYEMSARLAMLVAEAVVAARPERATVERSIQGRPAGSIYVDAMQNARGKSMASAYSVRAKGAATVSAPLRASELTGRLRTEAFTVRTMPPRAVRVGDLWGTALGRSVTARGLARAMQGLEATLAATKPGHGRKRSRTGGAGAGSTAGRGRATRR
jgi:bifunctional non-homologous end joining protein LigD